MMKSIKDKNKELIEEYPWLCPERDDDGKPAADYDYSYTELDLIPSGWCDLVLDLCKELKPLLIKHGIYEKYALSEIKEKWYSLCWYDYLLDFRSVPWDVMALVGEYLDKSTEICMTCGAPIERNQTMCDNCNKIVDSICSMPCQYATIYSGDKNEVLERSDCNGYKDLSPARANIVYMLTAR